MKSSSSRWSARSVAGSLLLVMLIDGTVARAADASSAATTTPSGATTTTLTESQREAASLLKGMTDYLAGLASLSVSYRAGYDVVQSTGQKIEFGETRRVALARPDRLRVEEVASDGKRDLAVFDGRDIFVFDADAGVYAEAPQPGAIDDALAYFVRDLRLRMPVALLLTTQLPKALPGRVKSIDYVESTEILGVPTHHVAGRTDNVDFQFWIRQDGNPWPLRLVITYVNSPGQPQFWANFADWNASPRFDEATFRFTPPKQARRVPFAVEVRRSDVSGPPGGPPRTEAQP